MGKLTPHGHGNNNKEIKIKQKYIKRMFIKRMVQKDGVLHQSIKKLNCSWFSTYKHLITLSELSLAKFPFVCV